MSFGDDIGIGLLGGGVLGIGNMISSGLGGPNLMDYITKKPPTIGANPYAADWNALITQLRSQANGTGPSLAELEYKRASQTALGQQAALSRGRSPGAARTAATNMSNISLGQAEGVTRARLAEQLQAQQALNAALAGASNADFQRAQANQQALLQTPTQFQQLMGIGGQIAGMAGGMMGGAPPMPMMAPQGQPNYGAMAPQMPPMQGPTIGNQNQFQPVMQGYNPWGNAGY